MTETHIEHLVIKLPIWLLATLPAFCPAFQKSTKQSSVKLHLLVNHLVNIAGGILSY